MNPEQRVIFFVAGLLVFQFAQGADQGPSSEKPAQPQPGIAPGPGTPDIFGGPIGKRLKLTGNWGGVRNEMAMKGIIAEIDLTNVFQHQASGGARSNSFLLRGPGKEEGDSEIMGLGDIALIFDMGKTGLWKDGIFKFRAHGRFGDSLTFRSGSLLPSNLMMISPAAKLDDEIFDVAEFSYTHFLIPNKFALFGGLLNTLDADLTPFSGGTRGKSDFLHADLNVNTLSFGFAPYKTVGGGFVAVPNKHITFITSVMNRNEMSGKSIFDSDNYHGVTVASELYGSYSLFGKPGGQKLGFGAAWDDRLDLETRPISLIADAISIRPAIFPRIPDAGEKDFTWAVTYNAWQYFQVFDGGPPAWSPLMPSARPKGWGLFFRAGISDGNPNPLKWSVSGGLGGDNPLRKVDRWGVGAFHRAVSDARLIDRTLRLEGETGFEAFYNAELTPWFHVSADIQYIETGLRRADDGVVLGLRTKIDF